MAIPAVLAALALTMSACTHAAPDRSTSDPTIATEPAPTTTTNPYAVPAVIDAAYVNRVLAGLDAINGDVTRLVVKTKTIPREAYDRLRAIYADDKTLQVAIDAFQGYIRANLAGFSAEPGNQATTVSKLVTSKTTCVYTRVRRDYSAIGPGATDPSDRNFIALKRLDNSRDASAYNQTGWAIAYEGFLPDGSQPPDPCVG